MKITKFKRQFAIAFLLFLCVQISGCQRGVFGFMQPEHTEFIVDGEYKPFNVPKKTMEKLMELVGEGDVDSIYEVFSQNARNNTDNLYEEVQEIVRFLSEETTSWKFINGSSSGNGYSQTRTAHYNVYTSCGTYCCDIDDVLKDRANENMVGFSSISIYPEGLTYEYGLRGQSGVLIAYLAGEEPGNFSSTSSPLEQLIYLAEDENSDVICEAFSSVAWDNTSDLEEKISELVYFLHEQVTSWNAYTWMQSKQYINGSSVILRETFFYLHTASGLYRCDIRDIPADGNTEMEAGFFSISIFPALYPDEKSPYDDVYKEYCTWGQNNMGISIVYW